MGCNTLSEKKIQSNLVVRLYKGSCRTGLGRVCTPPRASPETGENLGLSGCRLCWVYWWIQNYLILQTLQWVKGTDWSGLEPQADLTLDFLECCVQARLIWVYTLSSAATSHTGLSSLTGLCEVCQVDLIGEYSECVLQQVHPHRQHCQISLLVHLRR